MMVAQVTGPTFAVAWISLIIVAGVVLGGSFLFALLISHAKTRKPTLIMLGLVLLAVAGLAPMMWLGSTRVDVVTAGSGHSYDHPVDSGTAVVLSDGATHFAEGRSGDTVEVTDGDNTVVLTIESEPPDWGSRPPSDYQPDSDYAFELASRFGADYVFVFRSPSGRGGGLRECLDREKHRVLGALGRYVSLRSKGRLSESAKLGMDAHELFRRFVHERHLVARDPDEFDLYTLVTISNHEGGDALVDRTSALQDDQRYARLVQWPLVVLGLLAAIYSGLRLTERPTRDRADSVEAPSGGAL